MSSVVIRTATPADISSLYAISLHVHRASYDALIPDDRRSQYMERYTDTPDNREHYSQERRRDFADPNWTCLVAEIDGEVVGFTCALDKQNYILKQGLFVDSAFQGMGIGSKLFTAYFETVSSPRTIRLYVMENNLRAKTMYEKFGFRVVGKSDKRFFGVLQDRMEKNV